VARPSLVGAYEARGGQGTPPHWTGHLDTTFVCPPPSKEVPPTMALSALPAPGSSRRRLPLRPYLYLVPALTTIFLFTLLPVIYTVITAFTNYNLYSLKKTTYFLGLPIPTTFVGLRNFQQLLAPDSPFSQVFFPVFAWTVIFAVVTSVINYFLGFFLAVLLNNPHLPERAIYRTLLIVPWALPGTITILIWQGMFNQTFGPIDAFLNSVGLPSVPWLSDPMGARIAILIVNLWLGFPFNMIVCLGGLQSIGADIYQAAEVDGATAGQRLRLITLPLVFQVTMPMLIGAFSFNLMNFGVVYLLTAGGPPRSDTSFAGATDVLATFIYNLTLTFSRYDKAAALGIIVFLIAAVLSLIGFRLSGAFKEVQL